MLQELHVKLPAIDQHQGAMKKAIIYHISDPATLEALRFQKLVARRARARGANHQAHQAEDPTEPLGAPRSAPQAPCSIVVAYQQRTGQTFSGFVDLWDEHADVGLLHTVDVAAVSFSPLLSHQLGPSRIR